MFTGIMFTGDLFSSKDNHNLLNPMTKNMIVICENPQIKTILWKEIENICKGKCEKDGHYYCIPEEQEEKGLYPPKITEYGIIYLPTTQIIIDNEQKITLTIEAPFVLTARALENIWFAKFNMDNKISIYPMFIFKGSNEKWNEGIDAVYRYVCQGRYGAYKGYWMDKNSINTITDGLYGMELESYDCEY